MRTIVYCLIGFTLLLGTITVHAAYYKWYDASGVAHFTQSPPPEDARNQDGSPFYKTSEVTTPDTISDQSDDNRDPADRDLSNENEPEAVDDISETGTVVSVDGLAEDDLYEDDAEFIDEEDEGGFFDKISAFFSRDDSSSADSCNSPWLVETYGICPLSEPRPSPGSSFKAKVVDNRLGVWSQCKGTRNGDVITFVYKGNGYWETDGGVPSCPYREGFHM